MTLEEQLVEARRVRAGALAEIACAKQMRHRAKSVAARERLSQQIRAQKRVAHLALLDEQRIGAAIAKEARKEERAVQHKATLAADAEHKQVFNQTFRDVCSAQLSKRLYHKLCREAQGRTQGASPTPVTLTAKFAALKAYILKYLNK